jgi:hypothetical protein
VNLAAIKTVISVGIPIVERLIPALLEAWGKTEKKVPLEEWLAAFGRGRTMDQIYAEARARAAATGSPVVIPAATNPGYALADEILTAAVSGVIPEEWRESDKAAAAHLRAAFLANG